MNALHWMVAVLTLLRSGWMGFDGVRALVVGDYVTPKTGPYAGKLGPWASLLTAIGLAPRGLPVKLLFVASSLAGLVALGGFLLGAPWGAPALLAVAIATLWYAPLGTAIGLVQIAILSWQLSR
jgi:hypothetical protein